MRKTSTTPFFFVFLNVIVIPSAGMAVDRAPPAASKPSSNNVEKSATSITSDGEKKAFFRWLVNEMQEQIYLRPMKSKANLEGWTNIFSQGASIEGVYHGMVLSSEYTAMENGHADLKAVRFFAQEMAELEVGALKEKSKNSAEWEPALKRSSERYVKEHAQDSIYTLKRVLGERLLSEIEKKKTEKTKLADWYASLTIRWIKLDIPFGMKQRNNSDEDFHRNWAKENSFGFLQWEVLNRAHRILNQLGGISVSPAGK